MSQALYRKYRSKALAEVIGQEHITDVLAHAIKNGHIAHAYLLTGPRGVGKTSIARILAHEINQLPYTDESTHLDIIEIDAASNRRIDDIRDLREKVYIAPTSAAYKVYIIDEVHMLTGESFNALLKILEEPPAHVVFILATTELHKLPATIVSRTQRFNFRPIELEKVVAHLKSIAKKEKIAIDDEALHLVAEHGEGSFRDSISLLDQLAGVKDKITTDTVEAVLGLAPVKQIETLVDELAHKNSEGITKQLSILEQNGASTTMITEQLLRSLRNHATVRPEFYQLIDTLLEVPRAYNPALKLLTVLLLYALPTASPTPPKNRPLSAISTEPPLTITAKPLVKKPQVETRQESAPVQKPRSTSKPFDLADWPGVLEEVRVRSAPLYALIKNVTTKVEDNGQRLVLGCRFSLYCKKLDDPKHRITLTTIIGELCDSCPEITTTVDKAAESATPAPSEPKKTTSNSQTEAVAAIMGGGEIVDAPQT